MLLARYVELAHLHNDRARLDRALPVLRDRLPFVPNKSLTKLVSVSRRLGDQALSAEIMAEVLIRDHLTPALAQEVLRWVCSIADEDQAAAVQQRLEARVVPSRRALFVTRALALRLGPEVAWRKARHMLPRPQSPALAAGLASITRISGRPGLAARYARLCLRKWPTAEVLRHELIWALVSSGDIDGAKKALEHIEERCSLREWHRMRLHVFTQASDLEEAVGSLEALQRHDRRQARSQEGLRIALFQGDLIRARAALAAAEIEDPAHFRVSHLGQLLNELELYSHVADPDAQPTEEQVTNFFPPAKAVVDGWTHGRQGPPEADPPLTKNVFQYWDKPDLPDGLGHIVATWEAVPGWHYRRFDRRAAFTWLREAFGADHLRAVRLARNPAEESDFLRLCFLEAEGGLYVDTDDMCVGSPDALLAGTTGAVFFKEALGAICNNVIYAPPNHPVIAKARQLALTSLIEGDNDSTWSKTGPGLVTRAVALFLLQEGDAARNQLTLVPHREMARDIYPHMQTPHKFTQGYWNPSMSRLPESVRQVLSDALS